MGKLTTLVQKQLSDLGTEARSARGWFRQKVAQLQGMSPATMMQDTAHQRSMAEIGSMYSYYYDPKTKAKLPYYDRFPLVLVVRKYSDGFLGINLHYLPPRFRLILMDKLMELATERELTSMTKLKLTYGLFKGASRYKEVKPCLKRYLYSHVQTKFLYIDPTEWEKTIFMPVESFKKAGKQKVWADSTRNL